MEIIHFFIVRTKCNNSVENTYLLKTYFRVYLLDTVFFFYTYYMKVLLFITGHRHLHEYNYFQRFLKNLELNSMCDIFIYCNNGGIDKQIIDYYQQFSNYKRLFVTTLNSGFRTGGVEAVSEGIEMGIFKNYDYVIHLHPDVFMTDDIYLKEILFENLENDIVFFITKSIAWDERFFFI